MDEKLVIFIYPTVCFVDKDSSSFCAMARCKQDLLVKTQQSKTCADAGKYAQIVAFYGSNCTIRKAFERLLRGASLRRMARISCGALKSRERASGEAMVTTPYPQLPPG